MSKVFTFCKDALLFPILLFVGFFITVFLMNSALIQSLWMDGV